MTTPYWRLPSGAYDEPDELRRWAALGLEAARRAARGQGEAEKQGESADERRGEGGLIGPPAQCRRAIAYLLRCFR